MRIVVCLVHSILSVLIHVASSEHVRENLGNSRQFNISGRLTSLPEKPVLIDLICQDDKTEMPLRMKITAEEMLLGTEPASVVSKYARPFSNGQINIAVTIFADQFFLTVTDSQGSSAFAYRPNKWFEDHDFVIGEYCDDKRIKFKESQLADYTITRDDGFDYTHHSPFFPGNIININGFTTHKRPSFTVEIGSLREGVPKAVILEVKNGRELVLSCSHGKPITKRARIPFGQVEIYITIYDTTTDVRIGYGFDTYSVSCSHGQLFSDVDHLIVSPSTEFSILRPLVQQLNKPVYVARYTNDSAYQQYQRLSEGTGADFIKKALSDGAFKYGIWMNEERTRWNLQPSNEGSIGFHFSRLPYHFSQCPCDCLSDVDSVILLDQFHSRNFTETKELKTIIFYQWAQNVKVRFFVEELFLLEIFSAPKDNDGCDYDDSKMLITSIKREFDSIDPSDPVIKKLIDATNVTQQEILIYWDNTAFQVDAPGNTSLTFTDVLVFVQVVGLKSLEYV